MSRGRELTLKTSMRRPGIVANTPASSGTR